MIKKVTAAFLTTAIFLLVFKFAVFATQTGTNIVLNYDGDDLASWNVVVDENNSDYWTVGDSETSVIEESPYDSSGGGDEFFDFYLSGGSSSGQIYQDIDITGLDADIDNNGVGIDVDAFMYRFTTADHAALEIIFYNADNMPIAGGPYKISCVLEDTWENPSMNVRLPSGTRKIRVLLKASTLSNGFAEFDGIVLTLKNEPMLIADTTDNDVDHDIELTFDADAAFTSAITEVSFNGHTLTSNQYTADTVNHNKITLHPSIGDNNYLRTPGTGNVVVTATGYSDSTVSQTITAGTVASLTVTQQPVAGTASGDEFATQPEVTLKDKYNNVCSDGPSETADIEAAAKAGTGSWTIGGTAIKAAAAGVATFTDLSCTMTAPGNGAITFNIGTITADSNIFDIPLDTEVLSVSLSSTASNPTNTAPIPVTITFSESVTGFSESDITVGNGAVAAGSLSGSGITYTVNITPTLQGLVTVDVEAGVAFDVSGNPNTAAIQLSRTYDSQPPAGGAVSIDGGSDYTNSTAVTLTLVAADAAYMIISDDSGFSEASYEPYATSKNFTLSSGDSIKSVYVKYRDEAGNETAAISDTIILDTQAPIVSLSSTASSLTNVSPIPVTITFSETVTGFDINDIIVGNGTKSDFSGSGTTYTVNITPDADGTVTVDVAAGAAQDAAGNNNTAAAQLSRTYNSQQLTVTYYYNYDSEGAYTVQTDIPCGATLTAPATNPVRTDYTFAGWYKEASCVNQWNFESDTIVGATNLYAKWTAKTPVSIAETAQAFTYDTCAKAFSISGTPDSGFTITYNQGSGNVTPVNVGTYNVVLTRAEDVTYASYSKTITAGLIINPAVISTAAVTGVTAPEKGAVPVTTITGTAQYTGTITWNPSDSPFAASTVYMAAITLTPKAGYTLDGVAQDFFTIAGATATNAANSGVITAVFPPTEAVTTYTVTATAGSGGSISPSGAVSVMEGNNQTFTITPDSGYRINSVTVDSVGQGAITTYTFTNVTASHTISVTFSNSTGGGDRNGKGNTPSAPIYNADVKADNSTETTLPVKVDKDTGSASIDAGTQKLTSGGTVITMPAIPDIDTYSVGIPVPDLQAHDGQSTLTFNTDAGNITIPSNMLTGVEGVNGSKANITIGVGDKTTLSQGLQNEIGDRPLVHITLSIDGVQTDWRNNEAPVTVSIPYTPTTAELRNKFGIVVWYIDGDGKAVCIPNGRYDPVTGMVTFGITHFSCYAVAYNPVSFNDVSESAWYASAVSFIAAREITAGTGNGSYSPESRLTRGEFIVMMMRAYDIVPDTNPIDNFSDAGDTYYTGYLAAAKRLGISAGVGNNQYAPGKEITRQEMFTLLYNALKVIGQLPQGDSGKDISNFTDAGQIDIWAKDAVTLLVETGAIGGSSGALTPLSTTTRAEMAQVLYNLLL